MNKMAYAGMWKRQGYGPWPTTPWIPLREIHFPTFILLFEDYLKRNVRKILDTTFGESGYVTHALSNRGDQEATQRVPLLVYFPKSFGIAGREISVPCSIADIPPTIYDLLGIDWWPLAGQTWIGNFGKSLIPFLATQINIRYSTSAHIEASIPIDQAERSKYKKESMKRLRSLGYIN